MGKSSVIIVLGFLVIVGLSAPNINRMASQAYDNFLEYQDRTVAHNIAVSGANIGANYIFVTPTWRSSLNDVPLSGGKFSVSAQDYHTNQVKLVSVGKFESNAETVTVILGPSTFAKFAYYSNTEGNISWVTGDTVWGPFHTQDMMNISGTPVFYGKVTARLGTNPKKSTAKFYGGYQANVNLTLPTSLTSLSSAATSGGRVFASGDLYLKFSGDSVGYKTSAGGTYTEEATSSFAPNGVILAQSGNVHVEGTVHGRLSVVALGSSSNGNIYIDNNIQYSADPRYTPTSQDMLGLISDNNCWVTDNTANNSDIIIQATILCRTGGFGAEHYSTRPVAGTINLLGGVVQNQRNAVGTFSGSGGSVTITHGFKKSYLYDLRLMTTAPPYYPVTGGYETMSWLE